MEQHGPVDASLCHCSQRRSQMLGSDGKLSLTPQAHIFTQSTPSSSSSLCNMCLVSCHSEHLSSSRRPRGCHWWRWGRWSSLPTACHRLALYFVLLVLAAGSVRGDEEGLTYSIPEEGHAGMFVGDVFQDADFYTKYNGDAAILSQLRFMFLRGEQPYFSINNSTGVIRTTRVIDREGSLIDRDGTSKTCANQASCEIRLDVAVQPYQYFQILRVTVQITDVNDYSPEFSERRVTHRMLESSVAGTSILTFNVQDLDSPKYSIQRFELLPASNTKFRVTSSSQPDGSREVRLRLLEALDRESESEYNMRIVAYDGGTPLKTGSVDVQILVLDTNDNNPTFTTATYEVEVPEDVETPHVILQVEATDLDSGSNGEVMYGFTASTLRNHGDMFTINENTGEITLIHDVDFESMPVYHLGVTAIDKGPVAIASDATVIVRITDVNDHSPEISVSTLSVDGQALVPENSPEGTFVSHVSVTDLDTGDNAVITCTLISDEFRLEYLYETEYQIVSLQVFDREAIDQYSMTVQCMDRGTSPRTSERLIEVSVSDVNDQMPEFEQELYEGEVLENSFQGAVAVQVRAVDLDTGVNAEIEYSVDNEVLRLFTVDSETGEVKAKIGLDREDVDRYQFLVYATDKGDPAYSTSASVIVNILDVNDQIPIFSQPNYSFGVFENEPAGTDVGALSAEDKDSYPFNKFNYTFLTDTSAFDINAQTGRITTKRVLNREDETVYHLIVSAVEEGKVPTSSVSLSIYVADMNDNIPVFVFPNKVNKTVYLSKDVPLGYIATRLEAKDIDIGNNAKIIYQIASGNEESAFDIDVDRGTILVNKDLHPYEDTIFQLNISATDSGVPQYTTYSTVSIIINGTMPIQPNPDTQVHSLGGNNLVIVIALASTSGVITIILVMAIICIRRQDRNRQTTNGKYNCRMEALKFLSIHKRSKKLVGGSTSSGSTMSNDSSELPKKKEVSFSLEAEENPVEITGTQDKSHKSWSSTIDHQTLQTPRACSSLLNTTSPANGNGHIHNIPYDHHGNHREGVYPGNGHLHQIAEEHREIEIQRLMELLKRDQDASSLTSAEGSNTDSGRGASEEGDSSALGLRVPAIGTDGHGHPGMTHLPPEDPEDYSGYSSNQVVPSFCDSSISFMSHHNSTIGSYLPPEHVRAASRSSNGTQRYGAPLKTFQNSTISSAGINNLSDKSDSTMLNMSTVSSFDNGFCTRDSPSKPPMKLKSILKSSATSLPSVELTTPLSQQGMNNYLKSRMAERRVNRSDVELSDIEESELTESEIKYSCVDVSDILNSKLPRGSDAEEDEDDDATTVSGSYTVDPKELCEQIDNIFFKHMM